MTISKEIKIGLLALVAVALSIWGYKFIMGKNLLVKSNYYQVIYPTVDGLRVGTSVRINGVSVGSVGSIELMPQDLEKKVLVLLDLSRDIQIPKDTRAVIISTSFMGDKAIDLFYARPCQGEECAKSGAYLQGETRGLLGSLLGQEDAKAYMDILKTGLKEILDSLNVQLLGDSSNSPIAKSVRDLQGAMANLNSASARVDNILAKSSGPITNTLSDFEKLSSTLAGKRDQISSTIDDAASTMKQLSEADIKKTFGELNAAIANLKTTIVSADKAMSGVSGLVDNLNNGNGTLGKLFKDEKLYNNLNQLGITADSLFSDIQGRPYRYIPLKSRAKVKRQDKKDAKGE